MATRPTAHMQINLPPDRIWAVLATPATYADWVLGADTIRGADANWPERGSRFYHRFGFGPFKIEDHTEVVDVDPPYRLVLNARARPMGAALVDILLNPLEGGTFVTMIETSADPLARLGINALTEPLVRKRNNISLCRLKDIAQTGVTAASGISRRELIAACAR
jgi:uncharacterized protein YndB with AHSA1/START domain